MNITFTEEGKIYTATLKISGPAAIHLEREKPGAFRFLQRSSDEGQFARIEKAGVTSQDLVTDTVITSDYYPMYVKIESSEPITLAIVTTESDVEQV